MCVWENLWGNKGLIRGDLRERGREIHRDTEGRWRDIPLELLGHIFPQRLGRLYVRMKIWPWFPDQFTIITYHLESFTDWPMYSFFLFFPSPKKSYLSCVLCHCATPNGDVVLWVGILWWRGDFRKHFDRKTTTCSLLGFLWLTWVAKSFF